MKLIYKLALSHLRARFFNNLPIKANMDKPEALFYKHYFNDFAKQVDVSLVHFVDPLNFKNSIKTINEKYLRLLLSCTKFRNDFAAYLTSGNIKVIYQASIAKKLSKLFARIERLMFREANSDQNKIKSHQHDNCDKLSNKPVYNARCYFRCNKQCKLPWTSIEIDTATKHLLNLCKNYEQEE